MDAKAQSGRNWWAPRSAALTLIVMAVAVLGMIVPAAAYTPVPAGAPITPNPYMEGNVTVALHASGMGTFGYVGDNGVVSNLGNTPAGSASGFQVDPAVTKPYTVDFTQTASVGYLQGYVLGGGTNKYVNLTSNWGYSRSKANGTLTLGTVGGATVTGASSLIFKSTGYSSSSNGKNTWQFNLTTPIPITTAYRFVLGASTDLLPANTRAYVNVTDGSSTVGYTFNPAGTLGAQTTTNHTIANAAAKHVFYQDRIDSIGTSTTLTQVSQVSVVLQNLAGGSLVTQLTVTGLYISSGAYLQFGTDTAGNAVYVQDQGNTTGMALAAFAPSFFYNSVGNLKVAFQLPASTLVGTNVSITNAQMADGSSEKVVFSFDFKAPSALALTYANLVIRDALVVVPTQYSAVSLNGASILTSYNLTANKVGTVLTLQTGASAGTDYLLIETIIYTGAQWDLISQAPPAGGFFTSAWLQFLAIIGIFLSVFGLGAWAFSGARAGKEFAGGKGGAPPIK